MRKAQNVVKFGLKLGAFAALAATLSSCFLVIDNGPAASDISNVRAQAFYCTPKAGGKTNLDFEFRVNNGLELVQIEAAFLMPPPDNFIGENPVLDNEITDPTKSPNSYFLVSTTIIGSLTKSIGSGTFRAAAALEVVPDGNSGSIPTVLNPIKAQAALVKDGRDGRVWVRGVTASGFKTAWAKAGAFTESSFTPGSCDPSL
jgi:hypothetical protein